MNNDTSLVTDTIVDIFHFVELVKGHKSTKKNSVNDTILKTITVCKYK